MDTLVPLVGSILLLALVLDGIAHIVGIRGFRVTSALFRGVFSLLRIGVQLVLRLVGGLFQEIGRAIAGAGGGGRGGRQRR
ncbi:hypothetical protein HY635_00980 [Candidatus Uhrbacteria bacterium]|nr:hypothetical protein [Candidatus Uhrbacteria bacterium]